VLLAVIVTGIVWVFSSGGDDDDVGMGESAIATGTDAGQPLKIHRCVLERDYGNARLDIELRIRNDSAEKLVMQSPRVRLLTGKGREVASFFLPFDPVPEVAAGSSQDVQLRYWLEAADVQESLSLEVDGKTVPVKSAQPFDLNALKNAEKKVIEAGGW
jgi:hypothetical protein